MEIKRQRGVKRQEQAYQVWLDNPDKSYKELASWFGVSASTFNQMLIHEKRARGILPKKTRKK